MFFEVKIFSADGELKRIVSPKKLSKRFWKESENAQPDFTDQEVPGEDWAMKGLSGEKVRIQVDDTIA